MYLPIKTPNFFLPSFYLPPTYLSLYLLTSVFVHTSINPSMYLSSHTHFLPSFPLLSLRILPPNYLFTCLPLHSSSHPVFHTSIYYLMYLHIYPPTFLPSFFLSPASTHISTSPFIQLPTLPHINHLSTYSSHPHNFLYFLPSLSPHLPPTYPSICLQTYIPTYPATHFSWSLILFIGICEFD